MSADGELNESVSQALAALSLENVSMNNAINIIKGSIATSSDRNVAMSCIANKLSMGDGMSNMRDRLARFEIRARYGPESAEWDANRDEIPAEVLGQSEEVIGGSQVGGSATPLASSPGNLPNNLRQWRLTERADTSDNSSVSNSELNSSGGAIRRNRRVRSISEPIAREPIREERDERSEPLDLTMSGEENSGRRSENRVNEEVPRQETLEEMCRRRAASTARRVEFASGVSGANARNSANHVTFAGLDRSLPAAFVTARSEPSRSEMTGRGHGMQREIGQGPRASENAMSGVYGENLSGRAWTSNRAGGRIDRVPPSAIRKDVRAQDRRERTFVYENEASEADEMRGRSYSAGANASRDYAPYSANRANLPSTRSEMRGEQRSNVGNSAWNGSIGLNSTLAREKNTCELYKQWGLVFRDAGKANPDSFISRLMTCAWRYQLSLDDVCRTLPAVMDVEANAWLEREERNWATLDDLAEAFKLQYCDEGTQECLRQEIEARTQGPEEEISVFLLKIRLLLDQLVPPISEAEQIDRAYRNLHPSYRRAFSRTQCINFREFQKLGKLEELKRRQELAYRSPPSFDNVLFKNAAYVKPQNREKIWISGAALASIDASGGDELKSGEANKKGNGMTRDRKCYRCNKIGHLVASCPEKAKCGKCNVETGGRYKLCSKCYRSQKRSKDNRKNSDREETKKDLPTLAMVEDVVPSDTTPKQDPAGRLARWHTRLQAFDIQFVHRRGTDHQLADSLSRACENAANLAAISEESDTWYARHLVEVAESPNKFPDLRVQDGKLYAYKPKKNDELLGESNEDWKLALPNGDRERVIYEAHDVAQAGHLGVDKTYAKVATLNNRKKLKQHRQRIMSSKRLGRVPGVRGRGRAGRIGVSDPTNRRPGQNQDGEFPAANGVYPPPRRATCSQSARACYRGGRHICENMIVTHLGRLAVIGGGDGNWCDDIEEVAGEIVDSTTQQQTQLPWSEVAAVANAEETQARQADATSSAGAELLSPAPIGIRPAAEEQQQQDELIAEQQSQEDDAEEADSSVSDEEISGEHPLRDEEDEAHRRPVAVGQPPVWAMRSDHGRSRPGCWNCGSRYHSWTDRRCGPLKRFVVTVETQGGRSRLAPTVRMLGWQSIVAERLDRHRTDTTMRSRGLSKDWAGVVAV
ncbi:unnamed protein product [Trichogramma brassicae]|uniref:CCHC-type domain-containing protein n=1 Tax=Trichogramma brassicae TaxID=86971 RepID=A0A6H5IA70_9HYME|nr:unnamed protein product [Trichogramma brassicae]